MAALSWVPVAEDLGATPLRRLCSETSVKAGGCVWSLQHPVVKPGHHKLQGTTIPTPHRRHHQLQKPLRSLFLHHGPCGDTECQEGVSGEEVHSLWGPPPPNLHPHLSTPLLSFDSLLKCWMVLFFFFFAPGREGEEVIVWRRRHRDAGEIRGRGARGR